MGYTYSGNGYVKNDGRTGNYIDYNYINLPQTVTGNANITYSYDANGRKLRKVSVNGGTAVSTDYVDSIQYTAAGTGVPVIDLIQTMEGRIRPVGADYEYDLTDHLGNARVTLLLNGAAEGTGE